MAFNVITTVNLDMASPNAIIVNAVQYDSSGRVIKANLLNNGSPWTVPSNCYPVIRYRKSDRIGGFYDTDENGAYAISFENNRQTVNITLALQVLTTVGNVDVQINFYNTSGQRVTSFAFKVRVQASVVPDSEIVSSEYYNALTSTLQQVVRAGNIAELTSRSEAAAAQAESAASTAAQEVMQTVPTQVANWLTAHITNPSNPPIDTSLKISGAAADAKVTGDNIDSINNILNNTDGFLDIGTLIPNSYVQSSNGQQASWNGNSATDFINIHGANKLIVHIDATNSYHENAFYKSDKTFISSFGLTAGTLEIDVPTDAAYVRFSNISANMLTLKVAVNSAYRFYNIDKIAKIGTSICFPVSDWHPTFTKNGTTINFYCGSLIGVDYIAEYNQYRSRYVTNMNEEISVPHDSWCIWNCETNTIQTITDGARKSFKGNYCPLFYNSNGNVRGLFEKYDNEAYMWKGNCLVSPYGTAELSFEITGTTINITCNRYIAYNDMRKKWTLVNNLDSPTISIPHDSFLVYIMANNTLEVLTLDQIKALTNKYYYVILYNSYGTICGPFEMYYNRFQHKVISDALETDGTLYPQYYESHVHSKTSAINMKLIGLTEGDAFIFITDIHYPNNRMHSPALIKDICKKTGITNVILNGDYINRETLKADALIQMNRVCGLYEYPGINTYRVVGNHEFNNPGKSSDPDYVANELSAAELRWPILNPNRNKIVYDNNSLSYYFDNEKEKIRYFVGAVTASSGTVRESINWIAHQVEIIPSGWSVIIFQHTVLSYAGNVTHVVNEHFENILNAMKAKTSYNYLGTTFDYTGKTFDFIACFCGDYHLDMDYTTADGALIIATTCDTLQQEGDLPRTIGTYNEQAFDVVVVNKNSRKIYINRIGAGSDREYTY